MTAAPYVQVRDLRRVFDRCLVERPDLLNAGATRAACWLHDARSSSSIEGIAA